jgi:hypothetical protein
VVSALKVLWCTMPAFVPKKAAPYIARTAGPARRSGCRALVPLPIATAAERPPPPPPRPQRRRRRHLPRAVMAPSGRLGGSPLLIGCGPARPRPSAALPTDLRVGPSAGRRRPGAGRDRRLSRYAHWQAVTA